LAEGINLNFGSSGLPTVTSSNVTVNPAAASKLTILTQPSSTATAGVAFAQQPVVRIEDQFGNLRSSDGNTVVTALRLAGSGSLQGTINVSAVGGVVTFTDLAHKVATNITIQFTAGSLTSATSSNITVNPGVAVALAIGTQPSPTAIAGVVFGQQPVIVGVVDQFGNPCNTSVTVTASRNAGSGTLQ